MRAMVESVCGSPSRERRRIRRVCGWLTLAFAACAPAACDDPFTPGPPPPAFVEVATGGEHSCALTDAGVVYCWGRGQDGELGNGELGDSGVPVAVKSGLRFVDVTVGERHSCALAENGLAYCWGWNPYFQRGNAHATDVALPVEVQGAKELRAIDAGWHHTCALTAAGEAVCWGYNRYGQVGNGTTNTAFQAEPVAGGLRFASVSAGAWHTCGVARNGTTYCWGLNSQAQLGAASDTVQALQPTPVAGGVRLVEVSAGWNHTCGMTASGAAYCWGGNEFGQLGDGASAPDGLPGASRPNAVKGGTVFKHISAGVMHTCGIEKASGNGHCWGHGTLGQLGNGNTVDHFLPQRIHLQPRGQHSSDRLRFQSLGAGGATHACGVSTDKAVFCWGTGAAGQLGNGGTGYSVLPLQAWPRGG